MELLKSIDSDIFQKLIIITTIIISLLNLGIVGISAYRAIKKNKNLKTVSECLQDIVSALGWELGFFAIAFICIEGGKLINSLMSGLIH